MFEVEKPLKRVNGRRTQMFAGARGRGLLRAAKRLVDRLQNRVESQSVE